MPSIFLVMHFSPFSLWILWLSWFVLVFCVFRLSVLWRSAGSEEDKPYYGYKGAGHIHRRKGQKSNDKSGDKSRDKSRDKSDGDHSSDDDSSSIMTSDAEYQRENIRISSTMHMEEYDDNVWSGTQRLALSNKGHKGRNTMSNSQLQQTDEKVDALTINAKNHLQELKGKQTDYKLLKSKIDGAKRDLLQCQGLLEVIEEKAAASGDDDVDIHEPMESVRTFTEMVESAATNFEDITMSLEKEDQRTAQMVAQLQDLKMQIADKKVESNVSRWNFLNVFVFE